MEISLRLSFQSNCFSFRSSVAGLRFSIAFHSDLLLLVSKKKKNNNNNRKKNLLVSKNRDISIDVLNIFARNFKFKN